MVSRRTGGVFDDVDQVVVASETSPADIQVNTVSLGSSSQELLRRTDIKTAPHRVEHPRGLNATKTKTWLNTAVHQLCID